MKKLFSCVLALLAAVTLYAAELNIYAYGLNATQSGTESVTIEYSLNAPATGVSVKLYHGNDAPIVIPITDNTKWAKGHNSVTLDLSAVPTNTYTWAIEASAAAHNSDLEVNVTSITGLQMRGLSVDLDPESPRFGTIYTADALGTVGGCLLMVSPGLTIIDTIKTTGLWASKASSSAPYHLNLGEDGLIYVGDWSDNAPNITRFDPANPKAGGTQIFGADKVESSGMAYVKVGDEYKAIHGSMAGCYMEGTGANRVLYTVDEDMKTNSKLCVYAYNVGNMTSPWKAVPSAVKFANTQGKFIAPNSNLFTDGHGGLWMAQHRGAEDASAAFWHVSATGTVDFTATTNGKMYSAIGANTQGSIFVTPDKEYIVTTNAKVAFIWKPYFTNNALDSCVLIQQLATNAIGNRCVAMDPAHNIYLFDSSNMRVYAPATDDNSCETPAKVANTIESTGNLKHVEGISLESSASVELGKTITLVPTFDPADATDQAVSWSSDNENYATVVDGVVTGVAVGDAVITVTSNDGGYQATCTVTVYRNPVTGITIEPNTVTLAPGIGANLAATVLPEEATDKSFIWSSDDEDIATVTTDGVVIAVAEGTTTIKATSVSDGEVFGSCAVTVSPAVAHISAWGLSSAKTETGYTFSFTTNMAATNAAIVFYDKASGSQVGEPVSVTVTEGANAVAVQAAEIPGNLNQELTWAVRLTGADNAAFSKIFESANITGRAHLVVDASPESDYQGKIYYIFRPSGTSTSLCDFDQNYAKLDSTVYASHGFMRLSIDENGKLWMPDWRDPTSGIYIVDPADLSTCTQFFQGNRTASGTYGGIIKNGNVEVGGSSPSCFIYGKGENRKLFSIQEDFSTVRNQPMAIYNIGTEYTRSTAPEAIYPVTGNDGFTNSIYAVEKGYWVSKNCPKSSHASTVPALEFYSMSGKLKYSSYDHRDIIDGCLGSGFTVDPVHNKLYMIDGGSANILVFDIAYGEDSVPTLTPAGKHYIGYKGATSMSMDIAGNLYVSATTEPSFSYNTVMKMVVFSPATNGDNTTLVPAKAADVVKPFATLYEFGSNQGWATNAGVAMKEVEENVFETVITFEETDNYFTFSRAQGATDNDWTPVDAHRYGTTATGDYWVTDVTAEITLEAEGTRTNSFKIPAGTYLFRVNLNTLKFKIYTPQNLHVSEIGDNQGWSLTNKIAMKEVEGTINVFKDTISFTNNLSYFAFTTSSDTTWNDDFKNARYGGNGNPELVDGAAAIDLVKGNTSNELCYTIKPGTYEITVNFNTNKVSAKLIGGAVAVSNAGYATYYNSAKAYKMPAGLEGYVYNVANGLELAYEADAIVPKNVGLVIKAAEGMYYLPFAEGGDAPVAVNQLLGTDEAAITTGGDVYYALSLNSSNDLNSVGFYWMEDGGAAFENGAHKAYLALSNTLAPARFYLFNGENNATELSNVEGADETMKFMRDGKVYILRNGVTYDALGRIVK